MTKAKRTVILELAILTMAFIAILLFFALKGKQSVVSCIHRELGSPKLFIKAEGKNCFKSTTISRR